MAYEAYDRFLEAVKKFPRWTNLRRRPIESNGGKILRSIIEEIARVEDAIIEYKKDFFLVNYIGREEELLDYIYIAQVGDIESLDSFTLEDPSFSVTEEEAEFIQDKSLALYRDGYVFLYETNTDSRLTYTYNGKTYYSNIKEQAVWNIFDEFAWWYGLERFPGERNASLLQRCRLQFINRPNSTEEGIRNTIVNAAYAKRDLLDTDKLSVLPLEKEEVKFLEPDEKTMALTDENGVSLYEKVSQFNRDIARTRKWDLDYWDNAFRTLRYLPHVWDADVDIYQDGVGYHDALKVSTLKNVDQEGITDINIKGYVKSTTAIDAYLRNRNLPYNIGLTLIKYDNILNPVPVQYRIEAEDLIEIEHPEQVYFTSYKQSRTGTYNIDQFIADANSATVTSDAVLDKNSSYKLIFSPKDNSGEPMEISCCDLITDGVRTNILTEQDKFKFQGSSIVDTNILFHGNKVADFTEPENLEDTKDTGFILSNALKDGSFFINLKNSLAYAGQPLSIDINPDSGWQDITSSLLYASCNGFSYDRENNSYISASGEDKNDTLTLTFPHCTCRDLRLYLEPAVTTDEPVTASITVTVDGIKDDQSRGWIQVNNGTTFSFSLVDCTGLKTYKEKEDGTKEEIGLTEHEVIVQISRPKRSAYPIRVGQIRRRSYHFNFFLNDEETFKEKKIMSVPRSSGNVVLKCVIDNAQNPYSPVINSVHIGPKATNLTYDISFTTGSENDYKLDIWSNCSVALKNVTNGTVIENYKTQNSYQGETDLILDLSSFSEIYETVPVVKKINRFGENMYVLHLSDKDQPISEIWIRGKGYQISRTTRTSLADYAQLSGNEKIYVTGSFGAMIVKNDTTSRLVTIPRENFPKSDKIEISSPYNTLQACFIANNISHITNSFTGGFDELYLYDTAAQHYIAYQTTNITKVHTDSVEILSTFSPVPKDMARLSYRINEIIPNDGIRVYFTQNGEERDWSVFVTDTLTIEASGLTKEEIEKNTSAFIPEIIRENQTISLSNTVRLDEIIKDKNILSNIGTYIIVPTGNTNIIYKEKTYTQDAYEDGSALFVERDGFNKLKYANIVKINKIRINGITYDTSEEIDEILTLMKDEGIICWSSEMLQKADSPRIEWVTYTYKEPVSLSFDLDDLYEITGYPLEAQELINTDEYVVTGKKDGDIVEIDYSYFSKDPEKFAIECSNPCYSAFVSDGLIHITKIAEDNSPVIHNGFYYVDGKEHYLFSNQYSVDKDKWNGLTIENGNIIENTLYLYKEAVNHLLNAKMECNHLDIHCIVDFSKPRARTNIDPLGHIGACESYAMWEDYNMRRNLTIYKNGYATQFVAQNDGYAILDITSFLSGHTTVSCLYSGGLKFSLAREIRILEEQALQSVYCEPVQTFEVYKNVAFCIPEDLDTKSYRYYVMVTGSGTLDEVLIHDLTEAEQIEAHHDKAIDKMGLIVEEKNSAASQYSIIEYDPSFIKYNRLETTPEGLLRIGATVDWNITKLKSYDLPSCKTTHCLYRSGALVSQKDGATIETEPIEIKYRKSIYKAALKLNQVLSDNRKGFTLYAYSSKQFDGSYQEIGKAENENLVTFNIGDNDRYIKFRIVAAEDRTITDIDLFCIYKEVEEENLAIYDYADGSAVTRIFSIGASGNYRFSKTICDEKYDDYDYIYVRGIQKAPDGECIWSEWKDTKNNPIFNGYELFQFKIVMKGKNTRLRILGFEFEVL